MPSAFPIHYSPLLTPYAAVVAAAMLLPFSLSAQQFQTNNNTNVSVSRGSVYVGGSNNLIETNVTASFIGGGGTNHIATTANWSALLGGRNNSIARNAAFSVVIGGLQNAISTNAQRAFIGGGSLNFIDTGGTGSLIMGGYSNVITAPSANIGGGSYNLVSGTRGMIPGGSFNIAAGLMSFAAGFRAHANHTTAFVWADNQAADFASTRTNQFLIRAGGGVGINTNDPGTNSLFVRGRTQIDGDLQVTGNILGNVSISNATFSSLTVNTLASSNGAITLQPGGATGFSVGPQLTGTAIVNPSNPTSYVATGHNIVGGYGANFVAPGVLGATIAGGGQLVVSNPTNGVYTNINQVLGNFGTVSGGTGNTSEGLMATVGGGMENLARGNWATISGGLENRIEDPIDLPVDAIDISTIAGGYFNQVFNAPGGTIGGGSGNLIVDTAVLTTNNLRWPSTIAGGSLNVSTNAGGTFIGGGSENAVIGDHGVVAGGANNVAGEQATVPGGMSNAAIGIGSFAAGINAKATNNYSFVWGGDPNNDTVSAADASFTVNAPGGSSFITGTNTSGDPVGVTLHANATAWDSLSDSNAKTAITAIDHKQTLAKLAALPVTAWNYKHDPKRRYIGPMAQDFHATFGLGHDDKHISTLDTDGVTLSAIKGLVEEIREQDQALDARDRQIEALERAVETIRESIEDRSF